MKRSNDQPADAKMQKMKKVADKDIICGIKWCSDRTIKIIRIPPVQQGINCPCPLAPGCHGQFLRASTNRMEWAIILGAAYTKEEARTLTMNYLRKQQEILLQNAQDEEAVESGDVSDVEVLINGTVSNREVREGSKPWGETLPMLNEEK